jgi:hypothetical protein
MVSHRLPFSKKKIKNFFRKQYGHDDVVVFPSLHIASIELLAIQFFENKIHVYAGFLGVWMNNYLPLGRMIIIILFLGHLELN